MRFLFLILFCFCCVSKPQKPTYTQAEKLFEKQKFIESAKMLSVVLDANPYEPGARNLLARCFFFLGNPDRSLQETQWVLEHTEPGSEQNLDALFLMGAIALESNTGYKQGKEAWKLYLKIAPQSPLAQKIKTGLAELDALQNPETATLLARSYIQKSKTSKALSIFENILKKYPNYIPAWHYQGMAFIMAGEPKKAIASWKQVLLKNPQYAQRFQLDQRIAAAEKL